jgi:hypothetical protein
MFIKSEVRDNSLLYNPMSELVVKIYPSVSAIVSNALEQESVQKPETKIINSKI